MVPSGFICTCFSQPNVCGQVTTSTDYSSVPYLNPSRHFYPGVNDGLKFKAGIYRFTNNMLPDLWQQILCSYIKSPFVHHFKFTICQHSHVLVTILPRYGKNHSSAHRQTRPGLSFLNRQYLAFRSSQKCSNRRPGRLP